MRLKHQPKQSLDGGTIFMRGCLSLCCPARPGTFLITIQSLSVYTISGAEWTVAQGSPWEALQAPPCPALRPPPSLPPSPPLSTLPLPPPTTPPQHIRLHTNTYRVMEPPPAPPLSPSHTHRTESHGRVCYFSLLLIFGRYWGLLWLNHSSIREPSAVLKAEVLYMSAAVDLKLWALKKIKRSMWRQISLLHKASHERKKKMVSHDLGPDFYSFDHYLY